MFGRRKKTNDSEAGVANEAPRRAAPRSPGEAIKPSMASPPPPRIRKPRGGLLSTLSGLFSFFAVLALAALVGLVLLSQQASAPGPLDAEQVVTIPTNTGTAGIADILQREGVIDKPMLFQVATVLNQKRGQLKAGEFVFRAGASVNEVIDVIAQGRSILHSVTIPEGRTSHQIVEILKANEILTGEIAEIPPEGSLMPDTYKFERGAPRAQILQAMARAQERELARIWERRAEDLPLGSPEELVILASIVEKETGRADERPLVAGVFVNRLNQGMRLQSDPTIVYGLVGGLGTLGRGIRRSEITQPTDYNTYVIDGLPPGPIANPGRAAMEAVANPSRTRSLFFVADGTGGHSFSETYDEHRRAVSRWRQIERERAVGSEEVDRIEEPLDALEQRGDAAPVDGPMQDYARLAPLPDFMRRADGPEPTAQELEQELAQELARQRERILERDVALANAGRVRDAGLVGRTLDVSEGTALDPLRHANFDLNSPQTVPELAPLPGEESAPGAPAAASRASLSAPAFLPPRPVRP
ncbi:MAG: endolytic transglycosylase MltG [Microvirga sp.]|nr:endolytic transglycosylase MltG [Microvirga sp.]